MAWYDHKISIAAASAVIGAICAISSNYFITSNKISQEFEDWKDKLTFERSHQERINRINQLKELQISFLLAANHLAKLKTLLHEYAFNEALAYVQPDYIFSELSEAEEVVAFNDLKAQLADARQRRESIDSDMAASDAAFRGSFKSIVQTHEQNCVTELNQVPRLFAKEIHEHDSYAYELYTFIKREQGKWRNQQEAHYAISSWSKFGQLMDWSELELAFDSAMLECYKPLRVPLISKK